MFLAGSPPHIRPAQKIRPRQRAGTQQEVDRMMQTSNFVAKGFSLLLLGSIAAITLIMAFAPAGSIYN